jgi:F-type H+-transporting ATPase subunit gamma
MASLKDIRIRIESTKSTQQITKALKLVSAAKLGKAQHQIVNMRPYAHSLLKMIANIAVVQRVSHPLLDLRPDPKKVLLLVLSSDRGLCGGFNSQIIKFTETYLKENKEKYEEMEVLFIGRRAADYFAKRDVKVIESLQKLDKDISYSLASHVAEKIMKLFLDGHYDEVRLIYNEFKSAISQAVVCETLLPVDITKQTLMASEAHVASFAVDMMFEPAAGEAIDQLLVRHFTTQVYRCMAESVAAEHGARMTAMENASNNARDVLNKLTLTYNKVRQEKITTELTEIVSGAESLK